MTIDTTEATPEAEHAALMGAGLTARQIAASAVRIAHSDMASAYKQLTEGNTEEGLQCIRECIDQMHHAESILTGKIWDISADTASHSRTDGDGIAFK